MNLTYLETLGKMCSFYTKHLRLSSNCFTSGKFAKFGSKIMQICLICQLSLNFAKLILDHVTLYKGKLPLPSVDQETDKDHKKMQTLDTVTLFANKYQQVSACFRVILLTTFKGNSWLDLSGNFSIRFGDMCLYLSQQFPYC